MNEKLILSIVERFAAGSIGELDLTDGTYRLSIRRDQVTVAPVQAAPAAPAAQADSAVHLGISAAASNDASGGEKITSPIVATYYPAASPDTPPFVKVGSKVKAGDKLCILEAMKMMNHLEAEFDCEILAVHASSGDLVEYGQALFTVKRQ
ncbi:MAG: acetyl-CoA carboxylase biotin carboxyl carrier protein [Treponema sp.]|jgi:acetyl-CoA carboxylase biotin carboxyl carrier protein|nr:acetyl-CoA carboxylase biotin carboxyl carrier protein [Treponema sp.]